MRHPFPCAVAITLVVSVLAACASQPPVHRITVEHFWPQITQEQTHGSSHAVGQTVSAAVGENIMESATVVREKTVDRGKSVTLRALQSKSYLLEGASGVADQRLSITAGTEYPAIGRYGNDFVLSLGPATVARVGSGSAGIVVSPEGDIASPNLLGLFAEDDFVLDGEIVFSAAEVGSRLFEVSTAAPVTTERLLDSKDAFRAELIFRGKVGHTLKLQYREYASDMYKPSFSQQITHDLRAGKVIQFRRYRLQVLAADEQNLTVQVLAPR